MSFQDNQSVQSWLAAELDIAAEEVDVTSLPGGASARTYARVNFSLAPTVLPKRVLVMQWPAERTGTAVDFAPAPFLAWARAYADAGLIVPKIYRVEKPRRLILLEDLGDVTLEAKLNALSKKDWSKVYEEAVALLIRLATSAELAAKADTRLRRQAFRQELAEFEEWGTRHAEVLVSTHQREQLSAGFDALATRVAELPQQFVHRDFQSRNLILSSRGLAVIDFQDSTTGPIFYDLASLLCDSYLPVPHALQASMLQAYIAGTSVTSSSDFWLVALQRKLKDAGRFVFLAQVRGLTSFIDYYPQTLRYICRSLLQIEDLTALRQIFARCWPTCFAEESA